MVLAVVFVDTALASLGITMVLPLLQSFLAPEQDLRVVDRLLPGLATLRPESRMLWISAATIGIFLIKGAVSVWSVVVSRRFTEHLRHEWLSRIGQGYLLGRFAALQTQKQGVLLNNWFNETSVAARFFVAYLQYVSSILLVATLVVLGVFVNWRLMLGFLIASAAAVYLLRHRAFGVMSRLGQLKLRLHQGLSADMAESLLHVRDLKVLAAEPARLKQIDARARDLNSVFVRIAVMSELPRIAGESLAVIVLIGMLVGGIVLLQADPRTLLPTLAFFFVAFYRLMTGGMQAMGARMKALGDLHSVRAVQQLLDETVQEDRAGGQPVEALEADIRFENVSFGYDPARPVVRELNLTIPLGKTTFLIGPSGAGKSTVLDLLLRLHNPTGGRIVANSRDISEFNLVQWRRRFGYVSQEAALFNGTIRMNLLFAAPEATEEQMAQACRLAGAHDFIQSFPQGYDTLVGDRGYSVSGGQRKRIAIARALMVKPAVLVLDEATTSFEQSLEREMLRELKRAMPELTIIQITHRLQSASDADLVIAMENGRVVGSGAWQDVQRSAATQPLLGTNA